MLHGALRLIRVGTIAAFLVGRFTDAADWSERAVENADDLAKRDILRLLDKTVPSLDPSAAGEQTGSFERKENLLQELNGDMLTSSNVVTLQGGCSVNRSEFEEGSESVFTFPGEFHMKQRRLRSELVKKSNINPIDSSPSRSDPFSRCPVHCLSRFMPGQPKRKSGNHKLLIAEGMSLDSGKAFLLA